MGNLNEKEVYTDLKMVEGSDLKGSDGKTLTVKKVSTYANLPVTGEGDTDLFYVADEDTFYAWDEPSGRYLVPAANSKGFTNGCRLSYVSATTIQVNSGVIEIMGKVHEKRNPIVLTWTDVDTGTSRLANTWYFVYVEKDPADRSRFVAFISRTAPSRDQFGNTIDPDSVQAKYHPTREARFVGSFRTNGSQNILNFRLIGNYVSYIGIVKFNYILQSGTATSRTAVNCRNFVPITSSLCTVYYEMGSGNNARFVGDSTSDYLRAIAGSGTLVLPVTDDSIYYRCSGNAVSLGIHGYYEDI